MKEKAKETENRKENPLITVVVPVYNVSACLRCCLSSIQGQSYQNLEILLINDGSTDDSPKICQDYCDQDPRFQLISQENQGLGSARNTGLSRAKGDCICFVDSDDWLHPNYVRILYENLITYKADLSICRFTSFEEEVPPTKETGAFESAVQILDQMDLLNALLKDDPVNTMVAWNKLMRVSWLKGFHFENRWHEDQFMINEYVRRCRKAVVTTAVLYGYRKRPDSIMGTAHAKDLRHLDDLDAHKQRIYYFYRPRYRDAWKDLFLADLKNKTACYEKLYTKENARFLKKQIWPAYAWGFRQYLLAGGLFRKDGQGLRLSLFLISPRLYVLLKRLFLKRSV